MIPDYVIDSAVVYSLGSSSVLMCAPKTDMCLMKIIAQACPWTKEGREGRDQDLLFALQTRSNQKVRIATLDMSANDAIRKSSDSRWRQLSTYLDIYCLLWCDHEIHVLMITEIVCLQLYCFCIGLFVAQCSRYRPI